jgi:hypothetical protein
MIVAQQNPQVNAAKERRAKKRNIFSQKRKKKLHKHGKICFFLLYSVKNE